MNRELVDKLQAKYPQIFRSLWGDPRQTCMAFGIECGDGWYDIIDRLCESIMALNPGEDFKANQIKEKFAGLRFYFSGSDEYKWADINKLVSGAENESYETCEMCGCKENVNIVGSYWLKSLCDVCREDMPLAKPEIAESVLPKNRRKGD